MSKVLIIKFELAPEVAEYINKEAVDLDTALNNLGIDMSDGVDTKLLIVNEESLDEYGEEDNDYIIVKSEGNLAFWGYEIEEVCDDLNIEIKNLRELGVVIGDEVYEI
jgi:hypothetical protein